jgi:hypothetical protein
MVLILKSDPLKLVREMSATAQWAWARKALLVGPQDER